PPARTSYRIVSILWLLLSWYSFSLNYSETTDFYTFSLHDALPIFRARLAASKEGREKRRVLWANQDAILDIYRQAELITRTTKRSEEHTSELQSRFDLVCRLLLEKKKVS